MSEVHPKMEMGNGEGDFLSNAGEQLEEMSEVHPKTEMGNGDGDRDGDFLSNAGEQLEEMSEVHPKTEMGNGDGDRDGDFLSNAGEQLEEMSEVPPKIEMGNGDGDFLSDAGKQGCFSSTAIVALSGVDYYVLAYESRLSTVVNGTPEKINDELDKLITGIPGRVYMTVSGKTEVFEVVRHRLPDLFIQHRDVTEATTMDKVAEIVLDIAKDLVFPMGFNHYNQHLNEHRVIFILIGTVGDTRGRYIIRVNDDSNGLILETPRDMFTNIGSGAPTMRRHQEENPQDVSLVREAGERFCVRCVELAIKNDPIQCGGDIKALMIPIGGGVIVQNTYRMAPDNVKYVKIDSNKWH